MFYTWLPTVHSILTCGTKNEKDYKLEIDILYLQVKFESRGLDDKVLCASYYYMIEINFNFAKNLICWPYKLYETERLVNKWVGLFSCCVN